MNRKNFKLGRNFVLLLTIVAIVTSVSIIGIWAYTQMYKQHKIMSAVANSYIGSQVSTAMSLWLDDQILLARVLANSSEIIAYCESPLDMSKRAEAQKYLERNNDFLPYFTLINVMYYLKEGEEQINLVIDGKKYEIKNGYSLVDSIQGKSIGLGGFSFSYIKAVAEGSKAFISEAKPNAIEGLPPIYMVAVPIFGGDKKLLGALGFGVKLNHFNRQFITNFNNNIDLGETGRIEIIDSRGQFIGSPNVDKLLIDRTKDEGNVILSKLDREKGNMFSLNVRGNIYDYYAYPVIVSHDMATDWWAMSRRDSSGLHRELREARNWLFFICSVASLFIIIMAIRSRRAVVGEEQERARRKASELKKIYFDAAPYAVIVSDKDWNIVDVNPAAVNLFEYSDEDFLQQNLKELILPDSKLFTEVVGKQESGECTGKNKNGDLLKFVYDLCMLENGKYLVFFRDETELEIHRKITMELSDNLKEALKESERLRIEAEQANNAKSEFLANMSHEIRTPMNAIIGISHMLMLQKLSSKQRGYTEKIQNAGKYLLGLINSVLDFSKIEAGKMTVENISFELSNVFENIMTMFNQSFIEKNVHFDICCDSKVPHRLIGDQLRLEQVLSNLIGNALKFTEKGQVSVNVDMLSQTGNKVLLQFQIKDTGIGMSKEESLKLFKAFSQADTSTTRKYGGTGLGLVISKLLTELMGGELTFESDTNKGTTFLCTVSFSLCENEFKLTTLSQNDVDIKSLAGKNILLVEDNIINQFVATEILNDVGIIISIADNGKIALDILSNPDHGFNMVLMDIQMPVMDGHEATRYIREFPHNATLPIIAMTAHAMISERRRCINSGMNDHLTKPIEVEKIYATLEYWFNKKGK